MADFDLDKYIENLKIKKEDLEQQRKKLSNIFLIVTVLLNAILFYIFYFYYLKKIISYIIKKNEIKDELIFGVSLFFKGLILIVVISAILLFCFILNNYFEIFYLKKINDKINSLYIDLKNIELEKEIEEENKKAKKIEEEIEHYFNKE